MTNPLDEDRCTAVDEESGLRCEEFAQFTTEQLCKKHGGFHRDFCRDPVKCTRENCIICCDARAPGSSVCEGHRCVGDGDRCLSPYKFDSNYCASHTCKYNRTTCGREVSSDGVHCEFHVGVSGPLASPYCACKCDVCITPTKSALKR
jgi:hypothetical protein